MTIVLASPYDVPLFSQNTFLQFKIDRLEINLGKRSASAPPQTASSPRMAHHPQPTNNASSPMSTKSKKSKQRQSKKIDDAILDEFTGLARAECWSMLGRKIIERQQRIEQRWNHLKNKVLETDPRKKKKRFSLTRRQFFNAVPWVDANELLRAQKNKFIRPNGEDIMEFWACDIDLVTKSITSLFTTFVYYGNLMERNQLMLMLPSGTTFVFAFERGLHLDELRAKIKEESGQPFHNQRLICLGKELTGSHVLGDFDVQPGDVISVIFK